MHPQIRSIYFRAAPSYLERTYGIVSTIAPPPELGATELCIENAIGELLALFSVAGEGRAATLDLLGALHSSAHRLERMCAVLCGQAGDALLRAVRGASLTPQARTRAKTLLVQIISQLAVLVAAQHELAEPLGKVAARVFAAE